MEMDDGDDFEDYVETTVPIPRSLALFVAGATSLLFFLPVIRLSIRPSKATAENGTHRDENGVANNASSVVKSVQEENGIGETTHLLAGPLTPQNGTAENRIPKKKFDTRISIPKRPSSVAFHNNSSPRQSIRIDIESKTTTTTTPTAAPDRSTFFDGEAQRHTNAARFSDPATSAFEKLRIIACHNCDDQTKAMLGLGLPYLIQAIISASSEMIQMALVGHQLGVDGLSAWVIIDLFIKLTSDAVGSVIISANTMICQLAEAEDEGSPYKIGSYLQLSILFYVLGMMPVVIFWSYYTKDVLLFLDLDPDMAEEGQRFAVFYTISILLGGIVAGFQYTLDVVGFQVQSTICTFFGEAATVASIAVALSFHDIFPDMTLSVLGIVYVFVDIGYLVGILLAIYGNGWLEEYHEGLFSSPLAVFKKCVESNEDDNEDDNESIDESVISVAALKLMISNACQLAFSNFLYQGEWQILVLFAGSLGAAEVAAWGILGMIWEELEYIVTAIAEGCEVRVGITLGSGDVKTAKLVSYKAIWLCFAWGLFVSAVFFMFEDTIPTWITTDPLLQELVSYNLPMISLANIVSGIAIMGEHVLWSQNRAPLSTAIATGTSGLITLPLAGISSYIFHFNLIGQTTGVAIGAAAFAALSLYFVVSSDWEEISADVIALHGAEDDEEDDEEDDHRENGDNE